MKKAVVGIVGVAALICAISAFLFLRNKSPKMEYIGGKYNRQYEYAGIFDTQIAETDNFTCSFEKGVFTDKELKDYSNQIYDDMQLIKKIRKQLLIIRFRVKMYRTRQIQKNL